MYDQFLQEKIEKAKAFPTVTQKFDGLKSEIGFKNMKFAFTFTDADGWKKDYDITVFEFHPGDTNANVKVLETHPGYPAFDIPSSTHNYDEFADAHEFTVIDGKLKLAFLKYGDLYEIAANLATKKGTLKITGPTNA